MQSAISLALVLSVSVTAALAAEPDAALRLSDADRARVRSQVEAAQKAKLDAAGAASKRLKDDAVRQGKTIDQNLQQQKDKVDKAADSYSWLYGQDVAKQAGALKKGQLEQQALQEKQKIANDAKRKAAERNAAAKRSVENIQDSVEGLKSQVSKPGEYGLQPKGSTLNVRNYGKN